MCYDYALLSHFLVTLWEIDFSLEEAYESYDMTKWVPILGDPCMR